MTHPSSQIQLRILCRVPPPATERGNPTEFGLQDKQRLLHAGMAQDETALMFVCDCTVKGTPGEGMPRLGGPFVHGTVAEPFVYLAWRHADAPVGAWIRRMKIPLKQISWDDVAAVEGIDRYLLATIDAFGSRVTAILPEGWVARP